MNTEELTIKQLEVKDLQRVTFDLWSLLGCLSKKLWLLLANLESESHYSSS